MTGAMNAAIAGLRTHMQNLNVIGNNVANVNTNGYKSARAVFTTSIYSTTSGGSNGTATIGGKNPSQIGYGSSIGTIDIDMSSGNYSITGKPTDMMIDGDGFFLVGSKDIAQNFDGSAKDVSLLTSLKLTRVGDFDIMPDGYLSKDLDGNVVYGFLCTGVATEKDVIDGKAAKVGDPMFSDQLVPIRVPRVYEDKNGAMHIGYPSAGGGVATPVAADPANGIAEVVEDKRLADYNTKFQDNDGNDAYTHLLDYGAFADADGNIIESDYSRGYFSNITVDQNTGIITATCKDMDNQVVTIGCVAIGSVTNPNGVTQIGSSYYQAGQGSGDLVVTTLGGASKTMGINYVNGSLAYAAGTTGGAAGAVTGRDNMPAGAAGSVDGCRIRSNDAKVLTSGLEMSKTDLAQEIASMITTQRGYQANTRIVTVTDSMLEELVNMKR